MTVKELIELNSCIGDINLTIRKDGNSLRLKEYHIGANEGIPPIHFDDKDEYRELNINAFDGNHDYYSTLINKVPKEILNLRVFNWSSCGAYRRGIHGHELERISIICYPDGYIEPVKKASADIEGQFTLFK